MENPDITSQEFKDELKHDCDISVLCRAIISISILHVKKIYMPPNKSAVQTKSEELKYFNLDQLVFIDETGVNIDKAVRSLEYTCSDKYTETHGNGRSNAF